MDKNEIHYEIVGFKDFENSFERILNHFISQENDNVKTSFIIFNETKAYLEFLDTYYQAEDYVSENKQFDDVKLVAFHPEYEHGEITNPSLHYSNRSPRPIIQMLSNNYLEENTNTRLVETILLKNEKTLNDKGEKALQIIINEC